jgi:hypothetical protein
MSIYRQIYEAAFGSIPTDSEGRTYEIHHIDGNHENNDIINLQCVSLHDHYDIHYAQADFYACYLIALRIKKSADEISQLSRSAQLKRVASGTHHFLGGELQKRNNLRRVHDGTHNFLGSELQLSRVKEGTHPFLGGHIQELSSQRRVKEGTHNLLGGEIVGITSRQRIKDGTHNCLTRRTCPHCGKIGNGPVMNRHHFNRCKSAP